MNYNTANRPSSPVLIQFFGVLSADLMALASAI
jgi:hypothetical protein